MATQQLTATLAMSDGTNQDVTATATWSSSDETVATVSAGGLVTAVAEGSATITATAQGQSDTCMITVPAPVAEGMTVEPATAEVPVD